MAISLNRLIKVNPSVIKAAGNAIDLNGVILSDNPYLPVGKALSFASADTVLAKFGSSSAEYKAAKIYFQGVKGCTTLPSRLYFSRFLRTESNAFLVGNNLNLTSSQLTRLSGDFVIVINGELQHKTIDLAGASSFNDACSIIQSELTDVKVEYNALTKQFKLTAQGDIPDETSITVAQGELATSLALTAPLGAYVSNGSEGMNVDDFFTALLAETANWYAFTTLFELTDPQHLDFASWVSAQNSRFNYVGWTSNPSAEVSGSIGHLTYDLDQANYGSVTPVYSKSYDKPVNILGYCASLNFNQVNGKVPLSYRTLDGLSVDVDSNTNYDGLNDNGYNFYGGYAANIDSFAMWQPGRITGDFKWVDDHAAQAWLNANIQLTILNTLSANFSVPYNQAGREMFATPLITPLEQFKSWGGCVAGTDLDNNQILQIKQLLGFDGSQGLKAKGYLIYVGAYTSTMRANRTTPPCYVLYTAGGAYRTIELNSVEVQ